MERKDGRKVIQVMTSSDIVQYIRKRTQTFLLSGEWTKRSSDLSKTCNYPEIGDANFKCTLWTFKQWQECIPVGCVPSATVATRSGGVSQHALDMGICVSQHELGRGCLLRRGVSAREGGVCPGRSLPSVCWDTCLPVNRMTDACENITLPQLRCGR